MDEKARRWQRDHDYTKKYNGAVEWTEPLDLAIIAGVKENGGKGAWAKIQRGNSLFEGITSVQIKDHWATML